MKFLSFILNMTVKFKYSWSDVSKFLRRNTLFKKKFILLVMLLFKWINWPLCINFLIDSTFSFITDKFYISIIMQYIASLWVQSLVGVPLTLCQTLLNYHKYLTIIGFFSGFYGYPFSLTLHDRILKFWVFFPKFHDISYSVIFVCRNVTSMSKSACSTK